jgi:hypothetical protein
MLFYCGQYVIRMAIWLLTHSRNSLRLNPFEHYSAFPASTECVMMRSSSPRSS